MMEFSTVLGGPGRDVHVWAHLTVLESMELVTSRVQLYNYYYYYTSVVLLNYIQLFVSVLNF
jgi:hypothetical protein